MKSPRAFVLLDVDDTILDFRKAEAVALSKALAERKIEPTPAIIERYSQINKSQWELLEEGRLTREQVLLRRFELLFEELGLDLSPERMRDRYEHYLAVGHYFVPGAPELLRELYGKYALYIVSNGTASVQAGRLASAGIENFFEGIFISQEIGCNKPEQAFFERCFARIANFDPRRAMIVGDSLTSDIRGGRNAGILSCWYNPRGSAPRQDIRPDYEIQSLAQLPALLDSLFPEQAE